MAKFRWKDKSAIEDIVINVKSVSDFLRYVGLSTAGINFKTAKKWFEYHNIDTSHFVERCTNIVNRAVQRRRSDEDVFCENSTVTQKVLRGAVTRANFLDYSCGGCGIGGEWANKPLTLHLDHINGCNRDNRKENLRWMCPNCHSQTDTFAGRNNRGVAKLV